MKIGEHSRCKILMTFRNWSVDQDYADPIYNYLVYGFAPGSFFTSVLANDFAGCMQHSHPANSIPALKNLVGWMGDTLPEEVWGSYNKVAVWLVKNPEERYNVLLNNRLIYSQEEEMLLSLKGERAVEPVLY